MPFPLRTAQHSQHVRWVLHVQASEAMDVIAAFNEEALQWATRKDIQFFATHIPLPPPTSMEVEALWEAPSMSFMDLSDDETEWSGSENGGASIMEPEATRASLGSLSTTAETMTEPTALCCRFQPMHALDCLSTLVQGILNAELAGLNIGLLLVTLDATKTIVAAYKSHLAHGLQACDDREAYRSHKCRRSLRLKNRSKKVVRCSPLSTITSVDEIGEDVRPWDDMDSVPLPTAMSFNNVEW